jgi:glycine dehydrogenase subunit 2
MHVRAYTYIGMHGPQGLRNIAEKAVLNANYLMKKVKQDYVLPYDRTSMHEFVVEGAWEDRPDVHALDISKRLMDYGFHPPTNYFPLIVHEALMIEPTETESKQTLDAFAKAMQTIANEARENPKLLQEAPHNTPIRRCDEVKAARDLVLCCWFPE